MLNNITNSETFQYVQTQITSAINNLQGKLKNLDDKALLYKTNEVTDKFEKLNEKLNGYGYDYDLTPALDTAFHTASFGAAAFGGALATNGLINLLKPDGGFVMPLVSMGLGAASLAASNLSNEEKLAVGVIAAISTAILKAACCTTEITVIGRQYRHAAYKTL